MLNCLGTWLLHD